MRNNLTPASFILIASMLFIAVLFILGEEGLEQASGEVVNGGEIQPSYPGVDDIQISYPKVSFVNAKAGQVEMTIAAYGELKPRWDVTLKAQVSAQVEQVSPDLKIGRLIAEESTVLVLEDSYYQSEKSAAELALAEAKLQLQQAQKKVQIAKKDWLRSGIKGTPSDLGLFKPQLHIAEKAVESSLQRLAAATKKLSYTHVKTPYTGIVVERFVGPGQQVQEGEALLRLIDHQNLQLMVTLNEEQWAVISSSWYNKEVKVYSASKQLLGSATMERGGNRVNPETRQYQLYLTIAPAQNHSAIPGQFVQVNIPGEPLENTLRLPESALTREGIIWLIDSNDTLRAYMPNAIHHGDNQVMVPAPPRSLAYNDGRWRVATRPLSFFLSGKKVRASEVSTLENREDG